VTAFFNGNRLGINSGYPIEGSIGVAAFPANTLIRSSGYTRSRSATELLHAQKTELPCLATVCLEKPTPCPNGLSGITMHIALEQIFFYF
jgi:hypothetical protein